MPSLVLIVSSHAEDAAVLSETLTSAKDAEFTTAHVSDLASAIAFLSKNSVSLALTQLLLPDSRGIATYRAFALNAPAVPVLLLGSDEPEPACAVAMREGALGRLTPPDFTNSMLPRMLRSSMLCKRAEDALFAERERAYITLNAMGKAVLSTDAKGKITYINIEAERLTAWSAKTAKGRPITDVLRMIDSDTREPADSTVAAVLQNDARRDLPANSLLVRPDGVEVAVEDSTTPIHDRHGNVTGTVVVLQDASSEAGINARMAHQAQHDFLTGLPNRALLLDRLERALSLASRTDARIAVLYLDLDNFKAINDTLGHDAGDLLLQSVSKRLLSCVRTSDTVSRQGGDEFVVLVNENKNAEHASLTAERILAAMAAPHVLPGRELHTTTSIGISVYPADGASAAELLKNADTAMYYAKRRGRNNFQFFNQEMNARAVERHAVEVGLRSAIKRDEFVLQYQPKVNLKTGTITGAEVLLRWQHPERGWLGPGQFVQIAEDSGLIVPIGKWVVRTACQQAKNWANEGFGNISVSVNISQAEFRNSGFLEEVSNSLSQTGLSPDCLHLELTEQVISNDIRGNSERLHELKELGVQLTVDDFGTGYSNLSRLKQIPVDSLKIDQSFIRALPASALDTSIVEAIIRLGTSLNHRVIAEGIETVAQVETLQGQDCEEGQGHYFSPPVNAAQFSKLLREGMANKIPHLAGP